MKILYFNFVFFITIGFYAQDLAHLKTQKSVGLNGNLQTSFNYQTNSIQKNSYEPFSYMVSLNLSPSLYGISFPFSFAYSKMNSQFSHPFYRLGVSPSYKWAKLNLGHRMTKFSKYTVSGIKSFGAGLEINPGKFRFAAMYGGFIRQRNFRTLYPLDDLNIDDYNRKGYVTKIGVGSKKNYVDLIVMNVADDLSKFDNEDLSIRPEANTALSISSKFSISNHIKFKADISASAMTRDMNAKEVDLSNIDDNLKKMTNIAVINTSTYLALARDISLDYYNKSFSVGIQHERVDPGYKTLGTYMIRNDYESNLIRLGYHVPKFSINTSIGKFKDNLNNQKNAQTNRLLTRLNINYKASKVFSIAANYNNFSTEQTEGRIPLNDTIRVYQANKTMSIMPQLRFIKKKYAHIIMMNYTYSDMLDKNPHSEVATPMQSNVSFMQYMFQNNLRKYGVSLNLTYTDMKSANNEISTFGPSINFQKSLLKNKAGIQVGGGYTMTKTNLNEGKIIVGLLRANYKLSNKQSLRFNFILNKTTSTGENAFFRDYTRSSLLYAYRF